MSSSTRSTNVQNKQIKAVLYYIRKLISANYSLTGDFNAYFNFAWFQIVGKEYNSAYERGDIEYTCISNDYRQHTKYFIFHSKSLSVRDYGISYETLGRNFIRSHTNYGRFISAKIAIT